MYPILHSVHYVVLQYAQLAVGHAAQLKTSARVPGGQTVQFTTSCCGGVFPVELTNSQSVQFTGHGEHYVY